MNKGNNEVKGQLFIPFKKLQVKSKTVPMMSFFRRPVIGKYLNVNISLLQAHDLIAGNTYLHICNKIRALSDDYNRYRFIRYYFHGVTFAGIFSKKEPSGLVKPSGLIAVSLYRVSDPEILKERLIKDPVVETAMVYRTPDNWGLNWVIEHEVKQSDHEKFVESFILHVLSRYNMKLDSNRLRVESHTFLTHDPKIYLNPKFQYE